MRFGSVAAVFILACSAPPVQWTGDRRLPVPAAVPALAADGSVAQDSLGQLASGLVPPGNVCAGSLRLARAGRVLYGVWWSPRPDSVARLLAARSTDDGATWSAVTPVDSTDRGATGCTREPPSVSADSTTGYVHVTYGMIAPEGPGLFFSHSMDGGATFHSPVPILYGEHLGRTSVASSGDYVVVAFEDPNSSLPRVGLAISRTMGHIFEDRLLPVSDDNGAAMRPLVAVQGHRVMVAWQERVSGNGGAVLRVRTGTLH
ncbi:MAG: sialidase family protein [bacterium]